MAWVQHMIKSMNESGRMAVVLPRGVLFKKGAQGKIRNELLKQDLIEAVITLGSNIFYGTPLAPCILVFKKLKMPDKKEKVIFIDATDQLKVGRAQSFLEKEHVAQIYKWFNEYKDVKNHVKIYTLDEIKDKDYFLNISFYIEKEIIDNLPSIKETSTMLKKSWDENLNAKKKFKSILKDFIT